MIFNEDVEDLETRECIILLNPTPPYIPRHHFESLDMSSSLSTRVCLSIAFPPTLEMKQLLDHLKYIFLGRFSTFPVIISSFLTSLQEEKLINVLREYKSITAWTIANIKGICSSYCMHKILLEDGRKP